MRMTREAARRRFGAARVAGLATVSATGEPHLVPVTFAVVESSSASPLDEPGSAAEAMIVFAIDHKPKTTMSLRRLDNIAANPRVAFLVDSYDEDWDQLWWVRADAVADTLHGSMRDRGIAALTSKYQQYQRIPPSGVVVGAKVNRWTGWQAGTT